MRREPLQRFLLLIAAALPLLIAADHRNNLYFIPDVPTDLGAGTFLPWEIVRADQGVFSSVLQLPAGTAIDGLHRMDSGHWLISVESPAVLGGILAAPCDVLEMVDPSGVFSKRFDGIANGLPLAANVDALFLEGGDKGDLILSFDAPTTVGGQTFEPADLVRFKGGSFSLYFDASAVSPPIPATVNVTGADRRKNLTILTFDVPVTLGSATYLPGDVVSWSGATLAPFHENPGWPAGSTIDALALLARPGIIPPKLEVRVASLPGESLRLKLSWQASCSAGAENYAIYEGTIGSWYSHRAIDCSDDGGDRSEEISPSSGNTYYLVVPFNPSDEGSYGLGPGGVERPRGITTCVPSQLISACP